MDETFPSDLPERKWRLPGILSSIDKLHKRPQYGYNQGGSSRPNSPAKVAATNADDQRKNKNGQKNAGLTSDDRSGFAGFQLTLPGFE